MHILQNREEYSQHRGRSVRGQSLDTLNDLFRYLERLIQIISYTPKGLYEHLVKIIRTTHRDYLNNPKVTLRPLSTANGAFTLAMGSGLPNDAALALILLHAIVGEGNDAVFVNTDKQLYISSCLGDVKINGSGDTTLLQIPRMLLDVEHSTIFVVGGNGVLTL